MLFMLTPEIKTNLILKELGIKRYSYRTNQPKSEEKNLNYFQKGLILTLLDKPFENIFGFDFVYLSFRIFREKLCLLKHSSISLNEN